MSYVPTKPTSVSGALQSAATATGNGTSLDVLGYATCLLTVTGTYTGLSVIIEGSADGTAWSTLNISQLGTNAITTTLSNNGIFQVATAGLQSIRARISAIASGSVTIAGHATLTPFFGRTSDMHMADKLDYINDSITSYPTGNYITTISTATTTTIASFPIVVTEIRVLAGTLGNVTVYDSTNATGTIVIPALTPDKDQVLIGSPAVFSVGCTVVTAAATILTVTWRPQ